MRKNGFTFRADGCRMADGGATSEFNCRISSDLVRCSRYMHIIDLTPFHHQDVLEALHAVHPWIPGRNNIRPPANRAQAKVQLQVGECPLMFLWNSKTTWTWCADRTPQRARMCYTLSLAWLPPRMSRAATAFLKEISLSSGAR